jgi:hypothetical protein
VLIDNCRKMQKSVKTDISEAITPTPVIRFQEDKPCQSVNLAHNNIDYLFITLTHRAHSIYCGLFLGANFPQKKEANVLKTLDSNKTTPRA